MADPKTCCKQEKKKIKLSCVLGTSDGIGGILVLGLGGILATATVIASYRDKSRKKRGFYIKHSSKDLPKTRDPSEISKKGSLINGREKGNEGLLSVTQITPPFFQEKNNNSIDEENNEIVDSSELEEKEVLIHKVKGREEKPIHGHQEIISDDSKFDDKGIGKDQKPIVNPQGFSSSDINGGLIEQGNTIKENSVKDKEVDINIIDEGVESEKSQVSEMKEEEEGDSDGTGDFSMNSNKQEIWPVESIELKLLESKSHFQFLEIRKEEEEEEEEESKGGSDGTGDSSMESNEVEPIEEKPLDMKELKTHFQISPEKIFNQPRKAFKEEDDCDEITGKTIKIMESMKEKGLIMVPHTLFGSSSSWSMFWVSSMFMAGLLLLLFLNTYVPDFHYFSSFY